MCNPNGFKLVGDMVNPYGDYNRQLSARREAANKAAADRNAYFRQQKAEQQSLLTQGLNGPGGR